VLTALQNITEIMLAIIINVQYNMTFIETSH
jgi:hypothetical protein